MNQTKSTKQKTEFGARKFLDLLESEKNSHGESLQDFEVRKLSKHDRTIFVNTVMPKIQAVTKNSGIWALCALDEVRQISCQFAGKEMLTEQIRQVAEQKIGPAPNDSRAWGDVIRKAAKLGYLVSNGRWSPAKTSHGGPKVLWTLSGDDTGAFMTDAQKEQARRFVRKNLARSELN